MLDSMHKDAFFCWVRSEHFYMPLSFEYLGKHNHFNMSIMPAHILKKISTQSHTIQTVQPINSKTR